jgi:glycosyltransferase involved in cell wall biosynthesis
MPFPYGFRIATPEGAPSGLAPLRLGPDAQIIVTVGYRLTREISPEWAANVVARLEAHPRWVWLLVGEGAYPQCLPRDHPQIKALPHQEDLDGRLQQCHVYLNPRRMGGGFSVLQAMAHRIPVVAHQGTDGGDKLGAWAATSDAQYWQCLDDLLGDEGLRRRRGDALHARFDALYNLRAATPSLLAALGEARQHFAQRRPETR